MVALISRAAYPFGMASFPPISLKTSVLNVWDFSFRNCDVVVQPARTVPTVIAKRNARILLILTSPRLNGFFAAVSRADADRHFHRRNIDFPVPPEARVGRLLDQGDDFFHFFILAEDLQLHSQGVVQEILVDPVRDPLRPPPPEAPDVRNAHPGEPFHLLEGSCDLGKHVRLYECLDFLHLFSSFRVRETGSFSTSAANHLYTAGMTSRGSAVEGTSPPMTTVGRGRCPPRPVPCESTIGTSPRPAARARMRSGRSLRHAPRMHVSSMGTPSRSH